MENLYRHILGGISLLEKNIDDTKTKNVKLDKAMPLNCDTTHLYCMMNNKSMGMLVREAIFIV